MKIKLNKGLQVNKESLDKLANNQMTQLKGQGTSGPRCTCLRHTCGGGVDEAPGL